jgi:hypothetical protein
MYFISVTIQPRLSCFKDMNVQKPTYIELDYIKFWLMKTRTRSLKLKHESAHKDLATHKVNENPNQKSKIET